MAVSTADGALATFDASHAVKFVSSPARARGSAGKATHALQTNGIEISQNDNRDYLHETLANGMRILVVSDPNTEKVRVPRVPVARPRCLATLRAVGHRRGGASREL